MKLTKQFFRRSFTVILVILTTFIFNSSPALAAIDAYLRKYLKVEQPVEIQLNEAGETSSFSPGEIFAGKTLFAKNCLNCHVGGANLPNPRVSLSMGDLEGANPPRDNIHNLVDFFRDPKIYDGSDDSYFCRQISENWMSDKEVENLAAFILRAAEKAPGWGTERFE